MNRPAAPAARAPAPGALDVNALNRPPFAGAIPHPVSPATIPDPAKAQRPAPRPIVIEHFTPESLVPEDTARRPGPGPKTAQPPAAPSRPPKESGFVASNAASGHLESPALTPSDVAAALESQSAFDQESSVPRSLLPLAIGTVIVLALAVAGVYVVRTHTNSTPPVVESYQDAPLPTQADAAPPVTTAEEASSDVASSSTLRPGDAASSAAAQEQSNASAGAVTRNAGALPPGTAGPFAPGARSAAAASSTAATPSGTAALSAGPASSGSGATGTAAPSGAALPAETAPLAEIHEVIPDIPPRVRESIRGHVRVAVRLIVDKEGSVFAALVDEPGPSRYFERLAIEAAKKWTFPPMETTGSRLELVRFDFTRQGATARAVEIE
ncbi:MAG TPA: hypothetical protein VI653_22740 [Steroidobacteraceae bacterium]